MKETPPMTSVASRRSTRKRKFDKRLSQEKTQGQSDRCKCRASCQFTSVLCHFRESRKYSIASVWKVRECTRAPARQVGECTGAPPRVEELVRASKAKANEVHCKRSENVFSTAISAEGGLPRILAEFFWAKPFHVKRDALEGLINKFESLFIASPNMQAEPDQLGDKVLLCHCSFPLSRKCVDSSTGREVLERRTTEPRRRSSSSPKSGSGQRNDDSKWRSTSRNPTTNQDKSLGGQAREGRP